MKLATIIRNCRHVCRVNSPSNPMKSSAELTVSVPQVPLVRRLLKGSALLGFAAVLQLASSSLIAQTPSTRRDDGARRSGDGQGGDRGNFNPQEMQGRMLAALRDRLEITDDEEWKLISERITKLAELRRNAGGGIGGMMGSRGGPPGGGGDRGGPSRGPRPGGNPEMSALGLAIQDKLPDAEIKSRLERLREKRREAEANLTKAQEELRAVLSIRQEAVAVMFGLLP
jgi:hypothetical protein